jgi:uncharacterized protein
MTMPSLIALPAVGFLVGLLVVSFGGGGGLIYVGLLTTFFNIPPAIAASTSLATIIPTMAAGTLSHWKAGNVRLRLGVIMLGGGSLGAIGGSLCSSLLPERCYNKITGAIMLLLSAQMLYSYVKKKKSKAKTEGTQEGGVSASSLALAVAYGLFGGAMSGLVGLSGGGPIIVGLSVLGCGALETWAPPCSSCSASR